MSNPRNPMGGDREPTRLLKFGASADIDTSETDVYLDAGYGQASYPFPTSSGALYAASSSGSDTAVEITVEALGADYSAITYTETLTGQTAVQLAASDVLRVNRAYVSGGTEAVGNVSITTADNFTSGVPNATDEVLAVVTPAHQQTLQLIYTVPADTEWLIEYGWFGVGKGEDVKAQLKVRLEGGVFRTQAEIDVYQGETEVTFGTAGIIVPAKADVKVTATSSVNNTAGSGALGGVLLD